MANVVQLLVLLGALQAPASPAARTPATTSAPAPLPTPTPRPPRPPAPPGLSWEEADHVEQTLTRMEQRLKSGRAAAETVVVTERQLNSYVTLSLGPTLPAGVSGLQLRLSQDRLGASALVDLDRVKAQLPKGAASGLLMFLGGTLPVEVHGRLASANGQGRIDLEQATVGGVSLPASLVAQIVAMTTKSAAHPQGFDILAPFPLPWSARQLRLEPGRALLDFVAPRP
ncbi:MAG TPA: hypothetical protein VMX54_02465 [Vicinamibacteria bacterium]|nr:hypothetical protein [Vicinamibacteria bacterium]